MASASPSSRPRSPRPPVVRLPPAASGCRHIFATSARGSRSIDGWSVGVYSAFPGARSLGR
jgi:hypothetical protein